VPVVEISLVVISRLIDDGRIGIEDSANAETLSAALTELA